MTTVAIQVDCAMRWSAARRAWDGKEQKRKCLRPDRKPLLYTVTWLWRDLLPGVCRTGVLSFRRVLPLLLSVGWESVTFSGAGDDEAGTELWARNERVDSVNEKEIEEGNKQSG